MSRPVWSASRGPVTTRRSRGGARPGTSRSIHAGYLAVSGSGVLIALAQRQRKAAASDA